LQVVGPWPDKLQQKTVDKNVFINQERKSEVRKYFLLNF